MQPQPQSHNDLFSPACALEMSDAASVAKKKLNAFSLEETQAILAEVNRDVRAWKRWARRINLNAVGILLLLLLLIPISALNISLYIRLTTFGVVALAVGAIVFMVYSARPMCQADFGGRRLQNLREKLNDTRLVGGLLEAMEVVDPYTAAFLQETLIPVLRRLRATQAHLLNAQHRTILYELMTAKRVYFYRPYAEHYEDFTVAALYALQQVGDATALPTVEKLIATTSSARIRGSAQECLPFLVERAAQENAQQTLLRPSDGDFNPETLLRAAGETGTAPADPQQLLRPGTPPSER